MSQENEFIPHSDKQDKAVRSVKKILLLATGTQWGKTLVGGLRMKLAMCEEMDSKDNFLITAPNYKIMQQSTLPAFIRFMDGLGQYRDSKSEFHMKTGGTCFLRTETDPDSVVGIPNIRHIWGDEAGKYCLYFWENIQARANARDATIDLTTSPYSRNWIYTELIQPTKQGKRDDVELIHAASWENPYHSLYDPSKRDKVRSTMDRRRFDMIFGGEFGQMAGLVYDCFDEDQNIVEPFKLPHDTVYYGGIDWGFTEPFVLKVRAITPNKEHYSVFEFYKTGLTVPQQMQICKNQMQIFNIRKFYSGHERPENIELFNQNGIPTEGVPEKDIMVGTHLHYELIKSRHYKIFRGTAPYTLDEISSYHYPEPEDLKPDDDSKELTPVGQGDHAMSAERFITLKTHRSILKKVPYVPGDEKRVESQESRLERLKRPNRVSF